MTETGVLLERTHLVIGGPLALTSGRQVWVTAHSEHIEAVEPQPLPAGTMIEPVSPDSHGVAAPGFWIKPVTIG
jgi:hypothetical protein